MHDVWIGNEQATLQRLARKLRKWQTAEKLDDGRNLSEKDFLKWASLNLGYHPNTNLWTKVFVRAYS